MPDSNTGYLHDRTTSSNFFFELLHGARWQAVIITSQDLYSSNVL